MGYIRDCIISVFKDIVSPSQDVTAASPEETLSHMLSIKSTFPPKVNSTRQQQKLREIGKGQCGTIYALPTGSHMVAKIPNSANKVPQLLQDYQIHARILQAMAETPTALRTGIDIPSLHWWIGPSHNDFWHRFLLPIHPCQEFAVVSDRVFSVPFRVREALVDVLCPPAIRKNKQQFLAEPENKNCLIRIYLGRRGNSKAIENLENFKLQNFPLHANEMEGLQLDTSSFAEVMAQTLAILHWKAGVDGNDIEFILGGLSLPSQRPTLDEIEEGDKWSLAEHFQTNYICRPVKMWLIDFDQCSRFEDNDAGLKQIVDAFFWNDPFYPIPNSANDEDQKLWSVFSKRYLEVSCMLTKSETPRRFISKIEEQQTEKGRVGGLFDM